jgi:hypothetical protein
MLSWPQSKVTHSASVASSGIQVVVNLVLPPPTSSKVNVVTIRSGQSGATGWRVTPPSSLENELTSTIRCGRTISRYTNLPHIAVPSGARMP